MTAFKLQSVPPQYCCNLSDSEGFLFQNILVFMVLFVVIIIAFVVAYHSLFWYFDKDVRMIAETPLQSDTMAEENYGKSVPLCDTLLVRFKSSIMRHVSNSTTA